MVHGAGLITRVERSPLLYARSQLFELFGDGAIRIVPDAGPAIVVDSQLRHDLEDILGMGGVGIHNVGSQHRDFQAVAPNNRSQIGKILAYALRLHMAAFADSEVNPVEADLGRARSQRFAAQ